MPERKLAISVQGVNKDFRLPSEQRHTLKERIVHPRFDRDAKRFHALQDVNFDVKRGEFFGIVGRNGSGKSTLLKCMAGIYRIDSGSIKIGGRLSTFIELGVGFNPDLAARDNVILNGIMLGLTPKDAAARVDEVIEFAELQNHTDLKLKNYSSGMQVRLAFSVMTQIEADVLLIDEVLAVGDASFQAKCFDVFRQLREAGKTIVLVTHDMSAVARFCDRAMLIEDGEIVEIGGPEAIGDRYLDLNFELPALASEAPAAAAPVEVVPQTRGPKLSIARALLVNRDEKVVQHVRTGDRAMLAIDIAAHEEAAMPVVTLEVRDDRNNVVFGVSSAQSRPSASGEEEPKTVIPAGSMYRFSVWFDALLRPGQLRLFALLYDGNTGRVMERSLELIHFEITSVDAVLGIANLPFSATFDAIEEFEQGEVEGLLPIGRAALEALPAGT
jgi:ABC-2 type transport system ATP-binding protein